LLFQEFNVRLDVWAQEELARLLEQKVFWNGELIFLVGIFISSICSLNLLEDLLDASPFFHQVEGGFGAHALDCVSVIAPT